MIRFYVHVPGWAHAMTAYGINEKDARARFRKNQGFGARLPKGTRFWVATD